MLDIVIVAAPLKVVVLSRVILPLDAVAQAGKPEATLSTWPVVPIPKRAGVEPLEE